MAIEKVLIIGAGSIGNHMAHASRSLGWKVALCDRDPDALERTRNEIYPTRYGAWDPSIRTFTEFRTLVGEVDLVVVGTPPTTHLSLACEAMELLPKAILIEKPLRAPENENSHRYVEALLNSRTRVFVGYNHTVAESVKFLVEVVRSGLLGTAKELIVEVLEHWGGIFDAHPWLRGPEDSYLGSWREGGGALSEHSHGLNLWQHLAREISGGEAVLLSSNLVIRSESGREYDESFTAMLTSEFGLSGSCSQDVITKPSLKMAKVSATEGTATLELSPTLDRVVWSRNGEFDQIREFAKTRPMDFIAELAHIEMVLSDESFSPLDLKHGVQTDLLISQVLETIGQ